MVALGVAFMVIVAVTASFAVVVTGVLLVFSLMVTPGATALCLDRKPSVAIGICVVISLVATWTGLFVSFYEPYPTSFFITSFVFVLYVLVRVFHRRISTPGEHRHDLKDPILTSPKDHTS